MKNRRFFKWVIRISLFALIVTLGMVAALVVDETQGLAKADLSSVSVQNVTAVAQGRTMYANVQGDSTVNIYRSTDQGLTWQTVGAAPLASLNTLAVHSTNDKVLFAGTDGGPVATTNNLWRSNDGGRTWRKFFLSLPANPNGLIPAVTALATDPQQPEMLYVGTAGQGVYRFDVGADGRGYTLVGNVSLYDAYVKGLVIGPENRVYALTNNGLFINTGQNWRKLDTLPGMAVSLAVASTDPQILYAGTPSGGVYRSIDGGQNWTAMNDGLGLVPGAALRVTALVVDEQNPQHVVVATAYGLGHQLASDGVYESYDGGKQWNKLGVPEGLVEKLTFNGDAVYAATNKGLVRYGEPAPGTNPIMPIPALQTLARPTGLQLTILTLTVVLAGLVLLGRAEWLWRRISNQ